MCTPRGAKQTSSTREIAQKMTQNVLETIMAVFMVIVGKMIEIMDAREATFENIKIGNCGWPDWCMLSANAIGKPRALHYH